MPVDIHQFFTSSSSKLITAAIDGHSPNGPTLTRDLVENEGLKKALKGHSIAVTATAGAQHSRVNAADGAQ
ncbi:hypothetical protein OH492_27645 [Vibrio chagasii]|nr:hypothetical protein [Vibrio chagasii]